MSTDLTFITIKTEGIEGPFAMSTQRGGRDSTATRMNKARRNGMIVKNDKEQINPKG
jgi:hypothetical protein